MNFFVFVSLQTYLFVDYEEKREDCSEKRVVKGGGGRGRGDATRVEGKVERKGEGVQCAL
jgi:hypothetical protein